MTRFQRVNPTVVGGNPETTPNVATPPKRGAVHSKDRCLSARRAAWGMVCAVRVRGGSPYRIRALEREESLRDVGLDERYSTCFPNKRDELEDVDIEISDLLLE